MPNERTSLLSRPRKLIAPWIYPLAGIYFFAVNPYLWGRLRARLVPAALLALAIYPVLFIFLYFPQVAWLAIWQGRQAWVNAAILVLLEGAAAVQALFEAFFVDETLLDIFDAVLISKGYSHLVAHKRIVYPIDTLNGITIPTQQLGPPFRPSSAIYAPFSFTVIFSYVILLPVLFVPYVGTPLFILLCAWVAGPYHHYHYFKLLGIHKAERNKLMKSERNAYMGFGFTALCLQLVPGLAMIFLLTTATGSALWAVDQEKEKQRISLRIQAEAADLP